LVVSFKQVIARPISTMWFMSLWELIVKLVSLLVEQNHHHYPKRKHFSLLQQLFLHQLQA
jgi:hypothetical protein